jgi:integrase
MKNEMAKPLGVTPASRGRAPSIRICVPDDLREAYGGREDFRISLGKVDWATAKSKAALLRAEKEAEFAAKRQAIKAATTLTPVSVVTPELSKAIAQAVYATGLTQDDTARDAAESAAALGEVARAAGGPASGLQIPTPYIEAVSAGHRDYNEGLTDSEAETLAGLNSLAEGHAAMNLARRRLTAVQPLADTVARSMGLKVDWSTESARRALSASLEEQRRAWEDRSRRDVGEAIPTPVVGATPSAPVNRTGHTLEDVKDVWISTHVPSRTLVSRANTAIRRVNECLGPLPLSAYTRAQGSTVIAHLLSTCKAQKTAKDQFDVLKSLLNIAAGMQGWIGSNPWAAHAVKVKKSQKRVDLPSDVLRRLFDSPLFKSYVLPSSKLAGGAAAYWVPLLGLYTGARQSDLCQLRIEDVTVQPDMGLTLTILADAGDEDEDRPETRTKNETARRRTPIHSHLIQLGFADYLEDVKATGSKLLFPDVKYPEGEPAGYNFSKWFSSYRKGQGISRRYQDFHAFRHTSRTRLTDANVEHVISSALLGHTVAGGTGRGTYDHSVATLREHLEKLKYTELEFQRSYPDGGR